MNHGAPTLSLEYAPQPAVGDVVLTRSGGVTVVTRRPSWRLAVGASWPIVAFTAPLIVVLAVPMFRSGPTTAQFIVAPTVAVLLGAALAVPKLVFACNPVRWQITADAVEFTFRRPSQVVHVRLPRADIADVRVERVRVPNGRWPRPMLLLVSPTGAPTGLSFGRRPELAFMADAFREGLGIGPDPLGEAAFPPPPTFWTPVSRRVGIENVAVTLHAPRPRADLIVTASVMVVVGVTTFVAALTAGRMSWRWAVFLAATWAVVSAFIGAGVVLVVYRLRRKVTIELGPTGVTVSEQSLVSPGRETWPLDRVAGFGVTPRGKRADLWMSMADGTVAPLVRRGPAAHVGYLRDVLAVGRSRLTDRA